METIRRVLAIPMWLTALALAWVLGKEAGVDGMAYGLCAALGLGIVLWVAGGRQRRGRALGATAVALIVAISVAGVYLMTRTHPPTTVTKPADGAEPVSETRLAALRVVGCSVFVFFSVVWCLF